MEIRLCFYLDCRKLGIDLLRIDSGLIVGFLGLNICNLGIELAGFLETPRIQLSPKILLPFSLQSFAFWIFNFQLIRVLILDFIFNFILN
jgi:hypothetical protein